MKVLICCILLPVFIFSCYHQKKNEFVDYELREHSYVNQNMYKYLSHTGSKVNNIDLINRFDTISVAELLSKRNKLLFIHLSGLYCSDCNRKTLYYLRDKLKNISDSNIVVFGTMMNQRAALILGGKNVYISKSNLTSDDDDLKYPYLILVNSSLKQELFFIPEYKYKHFLDSCIMNIKARLIEK